ncbi:MAG TPA: hypothetical protein DDW67_02315 [Elusimicrobia bacterium]|jgi:hypothetical protein|nr:hypothetical protein [Elusimicrobiota bacterium]
MTIFRILALTALAATASGCVRVNQVDRGTLSKQTMQFEPMGNRQSFIGEFHAIREGSSGGVNQSAGGGCGCN